jgi:hypothetical protein
MREKLKLSSEGDGSGSKKCSEMAPWSGLAESAFGGSLDSGGRFVLVRLTESGFISPEDVFKCNLLYKELLWNVVIAVCKHSAVINCINVRHKMGSFL